MRLNVVCMRLCMLACIVLKQAVTCRAANGMSKAHGYTIDADLHDTSPISPILFGIFFEEVLYCNRHRHT